MLQGHWWTRPARDEKAFVVAVKLEVVVQPVASRLSGMSEQSLQLAKYLTNPYVQRRSRGSEYQARQLGGRTQAVAQYV